MCLCLETGSVSKRVNSTLTGIQPCMVFPCMAELLRINHELRSTKRALESRDSRAKL